MPAFNFLSPSDGWRATLRKYSVAWRVGIPSAFFLLLSFLTLVAPPGLCTCWLIQNIKTVHPHFSQAHAESQHTHDYLLQISQTTHSEVLPLAIVPANLLITLAFAGLIWWGLREEDVSGMGWLPGIPVEPPEGSNEGMMI